jgi:hypothetical protein
VAVRREHFRIRVRQPLERDEEPLVTVGQGLRRQQQDRSLSR